MRASPSAECRWKPQTPTCAPHRCPESNPKLLNDREILQTWKRGKCHHPTVHSPTETACRLLSWSRRLPTAWTCPWCTLVPTETTRGDVNTFPRHELRGQITTAFFSFANLTHHVLFVPTILELEKQGGRPTRNIVCTNIHVDELVSGGASRVEPPLTSSVWP